MDILGKFFVLAFAIILCVHVSDSSARTCPTYSYGPTPSTLSGTLISERHYRPPYYDENPNHDVLIRILILKLDTPISTTSDTPQQVGYRCISKLQLMGDLPNRIWRSVGNRLTIQGTLFPQEIVRHYTRVLLMVEDVQFLETAPSANRKAE